MEKPKENLIVIEWEDFEQELARLSSLSSALRDAKDKKFGLQEKLDSLIKVKAESLNRLNELDEMCLKLEDRKLAMGNMIMRLKVAADVANNQEDQLGAEVRSLLVQGTSLSTARKQLQEAGRLLAGEKGYGHSMKLQKKLRMRQQHMISQVSFLYPVKTMIGQANEQELEAYPSSSRSGNYPESKPRYQGALTILGLRLSMLPFKKMSFFTDKKDIQRSATAVGYVAHSVLLIASYLQVPLRYPLRFGGSHSYINDFAPVVEPTSSSTTSLSTNLKPAEFPLFLDGQDTTRAAYAVFLLNKNLEQLLNYVGVESVGPSHVLANLKQLLRTILSQDYYMDTCSSNQDLTVSRRCD